MGKQADKGKRKPIFAEPSLETDKPTVSGGLSSIGKGIANSFFNDVFKGAATDSIPSQFFNIEKKSKHESSDLKAGEEFSLKKQEKAILHKQQHKETYFEEIKNVEKRAEANADRVFEQRVEEIRDEIRKLIQLSQEMQTQFRDIARDTTTKKTVKAGKYHLTFFDWILSMLRNARMKMQEGDSWTKAFASKKKQKGYWNMFKKHGTSFGLSGERSTATQTG